MELALERDTTVLIGENNAGKTSVLAALQLCLDTVRSDRVCNFSELDCYRDETWEGIAASDPIRITLNFFESEAFQWPEHTTQALSDVIVGSDYSTITLRLTAKYDADAGGLTQGWSFLDDADNELPGKAAMIGELRQKRPFFLQTALRAAKDQFHGQSTYWASFLRNRDIDDTTRRMLEKELYQISQRIVSEHKSFQYVADEMKRISGPMPAGQVEAVTIDPAPADIYKALRYTDVNLLAASSAMVPIHSHGEGDTEPIRVAPV